MMTAYLTLGGGVGQSNLCMPHKGSYQIGDLLMAGGQFFCTPNWSMIVGVFLSWTLLFFLPYAAMLIALKFGPSLWRKYRGSGRTSKLK